MSPSDLPWWGWLIVSAVCGGLFVLSIGLREEHDGCLSILRYPLGFLSGLGGVGTLIIGMVRFIKWVWVS